jgi:hypothetical protein
MAATTPNIAARRDGNLRHACWRTALTDHFSGCGEALIVIGDADSYARNFANLGNKINKMQLVTADRQFVAACLISLGCRPRLTLFVKYALFD